MRLFGNLRGNGLLIIVLEDREGVEAARLSAGPPKSERCGVSILCVDFTRIAFDAGSDMVSARNIVGGPSGI